MVLMYQQQVWPICFDKQKISKFVARDTQTTEHLDLLKMVGWTQQKYTQRSLILMSRFNKKLTIALPEESPYSHQNQSPSAPESHSHDKQALLQFKQFRDGGDSEFGDGRQDTNNTKMNFVQFVEFNVGRFDGKEKIKTQEDRKSPKNLRNFVIEVPDRDDDRADDRKFKSHRANDSGGIVYEEDRFKQPPAPSKGSKQSKVFVFPPAVAKNEEKGSGQKSKQTEVEYEELKKSFERERQQFYKQKSKLEKQILIKNGQIQMLHKLLTQNFASPAAQRHDKGNAHYPSDLINLQQFENILLQKDIQINELLEKISDLNSLINRKNQQLNKKAIESTSLQSMNESLKNQLYIYERKDHSEKLTKKFYELQKQKAKQEQQYMFPVEHREFGFKGLESLHKRIEMVRMNRMEFDSRSKINSEVSYSQSTKNKPKGAFDFKGKTFEPAANLNKTRMY